MGCGACSPKNRQPTTYRWTSADGKTIKTYSTETEAKAQQNRAGGAYIPQN